MKNSKNSKLAALAKTLNGPVKPEASFQRAPSNDKKRALVYQTPEIQDLVDKLRTELAHHGIPSAHRIWLAGIYALDQLSRDKGKEIVAHLKSTDRRRK